MLDIKFFLSLCKKHCVCLSKWCVYFHIKRGREIRSAVVSRMLKPSVTVQTQGCPLVMGSPRTHVQRAESLNPPTFCSQVGLKEVEDILREVDLNGDGLVDFEGKSLCTRYIFVARCVESSAPPASRHAPPLPSQSLCEWCLAKISRWSALNVKPCPALYLTQNRTRWDLWATHIWTTLELKLLECYGARSHLTLSNQ